MILFCDLDSHALDAHAVHFEHRDLEIFKLEALARLGEGAEALERPAADGGAVGLEFVLVPAEQLEKIVHDHVAVDESAEGDGSGKVLGHAFCIFEQIVGDAVRTDVKTLYVDDICIDENARGRHIGTAIYQYVEDFARKSGCYNLTLNVWSCNPGAQRFYEACGLMPQKVGMEKIL